MGQGNSGVRVLGVDPGSKATGWALLGGTSSRPRVLQAGLIRLPASLPFPTRLARLRVEFDRLLEALEPDRAAVETPFHGKSARAALQLAQARGVILAALALREIETAEYTPATIKKQVTGNGRADKQQVAFMMERLVGARLADQPHDVGDAMAVALCRLCEVDLAVTGGPGR